MTDANQIKTTIITLRRTNTRIVDISKEEKELKSMKNYYERIIIEHMKDQDLQEILLSKSGRKIILDTKTKKLGLKTQIKNRLFEYYNGNDEKAKNLYKYICDREGDEYEIKKVFKENKNKIDV